MSTRTRHTNSQMPSGDFVITNYRPDGSFESQYTYPCSGKVGSYSDMTDVVTPGFKKLVAEGRIIMQPMHRFVLSREENQSDFSVTHPGWGQRTIVGDFGSLLESMVSDPVSGAADNLVSLAGPGCLVKAYAKMNQASLCSLETVKDLGETIQMLKHPFQGSIDLCKRMLKYKKKRLGKTTASAIRASSDAWLEYRYGWSPLLMDAESIIDGVHKIRTPDEKRRYVARAGLQKVVEGDPPKTVRTPVSGTPGGITLECSSHFKRTVRVSAGVMYDRRDQTPTEKLNELLGTRARDLPASLWECIPYSFVVDWFVGVGDWLQAVTPNPTVNVLGNWITTIQESDVSYYDIKGSLYVGTSPAATHVCSLGNTRVTMFSFDRAVNQAITTLPVPKPPYVSSVKHVVDGIALSSGRVLEFLKGLRH